MTSISSLAEHAPSITSYLTTYGYIGAAIWFTIFDFVAPFPDEISLLTIGYMSATGIFHPLIVGAIAFTSFVLTDSLSFFLVRKGKNIFGFAHKKPKKHTLRRWVTEHLEKNLGGTIIAICFVPRMRLWGPIVAGSLKIPYRKFIAFDMIGVALFVSVYETLGYFFGISLTAIFDHVKNLRTPVFVGILLLLGLFLIYISGRAAEKEEE